MAQLRALDSLRRCWSFFRELESTLLGLRSLSKKYYLPKEL